MTITLNIKPEVRAELARQAAAQGRAIEAVAASLLEQAVCLPAAAPEATTSSLCDKYCSKICRSATARCRPRARNTSAN